MKVYLFDLLPYDQHFDEFKAERFMPYPLPGGHRAQGFSGRNNLIPQHLGYIVTGDARRYFTISRKSARAAAE